MGSLKERIRLFEEYALRNIDRRLDALHKGVRDPGEVGMFEFMNMPAIYDVMVEQSDNPIVVSIPHSGLAVPEGYPALYKLPNHDWYIDQLYDFLPKTGITTIKANYSRYLIDLNRSLDEPLFGSFYTSAIAETDSYGEVIYDTKLSDSEIRKRIDPFYITYHLKLRALLDEKVARFGYAYLIDLHAFAGGVDEDICLGNRDGEDWAGMVITDQDVNIPQHRSFRAG